jgi:hypothetical protein
MKIAILVPSRERMNRRLTMLMSILTTVKDINNVNIYFGVDDDDPTLPIIIKVAQAIPCVKIVNIPNDNKFIGLGKMWNYCAKASTEEIISMIGDDMVFATQNWDEMLINEFKNAPADGIYGIHCNDGFHGEKLAVNFFCLRKYSDLMNGKFMREEFMINWIDQWLHQVFSSVGRLKYRGDIMIEHRHWVLGKDKKDKVADRMAVADTNKISDKLWYDLVKERIEDVKKVSAYTNLKPDWSKVDTTNGNQYIHG